MATLTGEGLAKYAKDKIGTPYFYGAKMQTLTEQLIASMKKLYPKTVTSAYVQKARNKSMVGKTCTDCSGLIFGYRGKNVGSSQLYQTASKRIPIAKSDSFPIGTVVWKSGHVGVYIGKENGTPMVVEAKGISYGVVKTRLKDTNWVYGLLFSDISYGDVKTNDLGQSNPYAYPKRVIKLLSRGEDVKWVQFALRQAGFNVPFTYNGKTYSEVKIDGVAGNITVAAIKAFQQSCKVTVDGKAGPVTCKLLLR